MIIVYVTRLGGPTADVSYNTAWQGLWAFAEISFGITVTGTFLLPKFIEAEGKKIRGLFSSLTRPFTSLTSGSSFGIRLQSKKDSTAPHEVTLDTVRIIGRSESDLSFANPEQDLGRHLSYKDVHNPAKYPSVNSTDTPHHVQGR